jgi:uncharacterized protein (TIGR02597 family)
LYSLALAAITVSVWPVTGRAQTTTIAATPAVGYSELTARGASDSFVSIPFVQRSALVANISAVNPASVSLSAAGLVDGTYAPGASTVYYLQFVSGNLAGLCYKILNNNGYVFTLDTRGDDLTNHPLGAVNTGATGDLVRIRPYWTIGTVFGTDPTQILLDPIAAFNGPVYPGADEILLPDNTSAGTQKPPAAVYGYVTNSGWREHNDPITDASATMLWPGVPFIIRRQNPAPVDILVTGYVSTDRLVQSIPAVAAGTDFDQAVSLAYPLPTALASAGLFSSTNSVILPSVDSLHLGDLVLSYPDNRSGFSLPPDQRFYVVGTDWFETGASADQDLLQPEAGYILRLRGLHPANYWVQSPSLTPP